MFKDDLCKGLDQIDYWTYCGNPEKVNECIGALAEKLGVTRNFVLAAVSSRPAREQWPNRMIREGGARPMRMHPPLARQAARRSP
jgi:hypothetical protein